MIIYIYIYIYAIYEQINYIDILATKNFMCININIYIYIYIYIYILYIFIFLYVYIYYIMYIFIYTCIAGWNKSPSVNEGSNSTLIITIMV